MPLPKWATPSFPREYIIRVNNAAQQTAVQRWLDTQKLMYASRPFIAASQVPVALQQHVWWCDAKRKSDSGRCTCGAVAT